MDLKFVLAFSVLLQFTAAFLALRLICLTGKRKAWLFISAAISLMALRRAITLGHMLSKSLSHPPDPAAEWVALAYGILALRFATERKRAEDKLRKSEEDLQERVNELEEFYNMALSRELRMIELKEELERLKESSVKEATQ